MIRVLIKVFVGLLVLVIFLGGVAGALLFNDYLLTRVTLPWISDLAGITVQASSVEHSLSGSLLAEDLKVDIDGNVLVEAKTLNANYEPAKLLNGKLFISSGNVGQGHVRVILTDESPEEEVSEEGGDSGGFTFLVQDTTLSSFDFELVESDTEVVKLRDASVTLSSYGSNAPLSGSISSVLSYKGKGFVLTAPEKLDAKISGAVGADGVPTTISWDLSDEQLHVTVSDFDLDHLFKVTSAGSLTLPSEAAPVILTLTNVILADEAGLLGKADGTLSLGEQKSIYSFDVKTFDLSSVERVYRPIDYVHRGALSGSAKISSVKNQISVESSLRCEKCKLSAQSSELSRLVVNTSAEKKGDRIEIKNLNLEAYQDDDVIADVQIASTYQLPSGGEESSVGLQVKTLDINQILDSLPLAPSEEKPTTEEPQEQTQEHVKVPDLTFAGTISAQKLVHPTYSLDALEADFELSPESFFLNSLEVTTGEGSLKANGRYTETKGLEILNLQGRKLPFITLIDGDSRKAGVITSVHAELSRKSGGESVSGEMLQGDITAKIRDVELPAKIQDVPPFNIIFLPFEFVSKIGGYVGGAILPSGLVSTGEAVQASLSEQGRIVLNRGTAEMRLEGEELEVKEVVFRTDLLPTIDISGDVTEFSEVDLVIRTDVAGLLLPIAVRGSLQNPRPSLLNTGPELIKALGASTVNIATKPFQLLNNLLTSDDDDDESPLRDLPQLKQDIPTNAEDGEESTPTKSTGESKPEE